MVKSVTLVKTAVTSQYAYPVGTLNRLARLYFYGNWKKPRTLLLTAGADQHKTKIGARQPNINVMHLFHVLLVILCISCCTDP